MSNETSYYFGAYLKIVVGEIKYQKLKKQCANGHKSYGPFDQFCSKCGAAMSDVQVTGSLVPTQADQLLGQEFDERLATITTRSMYGTGVILAKANVSTDGEWMYLPRDQSETKPFPTDAEVAAMKASLAKQYSKEIEALRASTIVKSVTVEAGFVLNEEY